MKKAQKLLLLAKQGKEYTVFTRRWWKDNPSYPDGLEPHLGHKKIIAHAETEDDARRMCQRWEEDNRHKKNKYSLKAEFTKTINLT
tara:strand:- start:4382 stop:4639 length:258 start_codon:yes stop_codon:yes gene_type:complete